MIEVEIKIIVKNITRLEEQLLQNGFTKGKSLKESDYYLDDESGSIRNNDQALRIRCSQDLNSDVITNTITYKGPKLDTISMTRKELEIHTDSLETGIEIFSSLGYQKIYPVIKRREYFHKENISVCIDQVEQLGSFFELEIIVENESEKNAALDQLISLLEELGYQKEDIITRSYLSMLQKHD
jgi:adenylate cyclase class 2